MAYPTLGIAATSIIGRFSERTGAYTSLCKNNPLLCNVIIWLRIAIIATLLITIIAFIFSEIKR